MSHRKPNAGNGAESTRSQVPEGPSPSFPQLRPAIAPQARPLDPPAAAPAPRHRVDLRIDEIVLHGFPALNRHRVLDAAHAELAQLLGSRGLHPRSLARDRSEDRPVEVQVPPNSTPESVGRTIARAIYRGLSA